MTGLRLRASQLVLSFVLPVLVSTVGFSANEQLHYPAPSTESLRVTIAMQATLEILKKHPLPDSDKQALLNNAHPDDREFVKTMLVQWGKLKNIIVDTDGFEMIIRRQNGPDLFYLTPSPDTASVYYLNGVAIDLKDLSDQKSGIVSKLKSVLNKSSPEASGKSSASFMNWLKLGAVKAEAADFTPVGIAPFYLFATEYRSIKMRPAQKETQVPVIANGKDSAAGALTAGERTAPLGEVIDFKVSSDGGRILSRLFNLSDHKGDSPPRTVQCLNESAKTQVKIDGENATAEIFNDGTIILNFPSASKTVKSATVVSNFGDDFNIAAALNSNEKTLRPELLDNIGRTCKAVTIKWEALDAVCNGYAQVSDGKITGENFVNTFSNQIRSVDRELKRLRWVHPAVYFQECEDSKCQRTKGKLGPRLSADMLGKPEAEIIRVASNYKPDIARNPGGPGIIRPRIVGNEIEFHADTHEMRSRGFAADQIFEAKRMVKSVNSLTKERDRKIAKAIRALRPLQACCKDSVCRHDALEQNNVHLQLPQSQPVGR